MEPEMVAQLIQVPFVLGSVVLVLYVLRFQREMQASWQAHDMERAKMLEEQRGKRDAQVLTLMATLQLDINKLAALLVFHHAATMNGDKDPAEILEVFRAMNAVVKG